MDVITRNHTTPASVQGKVEKCSATFHLSFADAWHELIAVLVQRQANHPGWNVIAPTLLTARQGAVEFLHPVHLVIAFRREIERVVYILAIVRRQLRTLETAADEHRVLRMEVFGTISTVAHFLGHFVEDAPHACDL